MRRGREGPVTAPGREWGLGGEGRAPVMAPRWGGKGVVLVTDPQGGWGARGVPVTDSR